MTSKRKMRVAVLYGGKSGEHEVSLMSAQSIISAMDPEKYEIIPIGISKKGEWLLGESSVQLLEAAKPLERLHSLLSTSTNIQMVPSAQSFPLVFADEIDVVFPVLHGPNGEDGTIQGLLQLANIPYVGCGVLSSAVGMDKIMMKRLFQQAGLPQGQFAGYLRKDIEQKMEAVLADIEERFDYPCFVKPANMGSSVGISKARNREQLVEALRLACKYDRKILVEENINAREIEVAVLGNDEPIASVPGEIISSNEFYDYQAKYLDGKSQMIIPAELNEDQVALFRELAVKAFKAIDGSGIARVDFFLEKESGKIYLNEINTMPGFTQFSMYPLLWKHSGIPYPELIDRLIQLALERHEELNRSHEQF
jgi:D-alanine-D-alanine ligase